MPNNSNLSYEERLKQSRSIHEGLKNSSYKSAETYHQIIEECNRENDKSD